MAYCIVALKVAYLGQMVDFPLRGLDRSRQIYSRSCMIQLMLPGETRTSIICMIWHVFTFFLVGSVLSRHLGKFGTTSIRVPDTPVSSVRPSKVPRVPAYSTVHTLGEFSLELSRAAHKTILYKFRVICAPTVWVSSYRGPGMYSESCANDIVVATLQPTTGPLA